MGITNIISKSATLIDEIPGAYVPQEDLETTIASLGTQTVLWASIALVILTALSILFSNRIPKLKLPLFVLMALAMGGSTLVLIGSTVYLNTNSESGGPIHWHADFEVWACGNELELRDPTGTLSNKIGTSVLHEHNDHRIHLEGVAVEKEVDASLGKFMHVIGGVITPEAMVVPLNADGEGGLFEDEEDGDGPSEVDASLVAPYISDDPDLGKIGYFTDGDTCGDVVSDVQVFVYSYDGENKTYEQTKLDDPAKYVIFEDPNVPPGDCVIFEFGPEREQTDKICEQYGIRDIERCAQFGVEENQRAICELTQVNYNPEATLPLDVNSLPGEINNLPGEVGTDVVFEEPDDSNATADPCEVYFDLDGNPTGLRLAVFDEDGNLIDPETDCDDYLNSLDTNDATEEETN